MGRSNLSYVSLFCGCGGFDLGFDRAGYKARLSIDNNQYALNVLAKNTKNPIANLDLALEIPAINSPVDVLLAGSPCQGFSTAGRRVLDDPRNELLLTVPAAAMTLNPKVVVVENVFGAISGEHGKYWDSLMGQLRGQGFQTTTLKLDCANHGVAQHRKRVVLIAWKGIDAVQLSIEKKALLSLAEAIKGLDGVANHDPQHVPSDSSDFLIAEKIGQGQKLTNSRGGEQSVHTWHIPEVFGRTSKAERVVLEEIVRIRRQERRRDFGDADPVLARTLYTRFGKELVTGLADKGYLRRQGLYLDLTHTFNGKYRRQKWDAPSRTVDTRFGDYRLFLHPDEHRGFSVREAARVQGFEDAFVFEGPRLEQFKMVGNAVPPPISYQLANLIRVFF
jgi:DNA (cytosine-5)-methyltransferase 1